MKRMREGWLDARLRLRSIQMQSAASLDQRSADPRLYNEDLAPTDARAADVEHVQLHRAVVFDVDGGDDVHAGRRS